MKSVGSRWQDAICSKENCFLLTENLPFTGSKFCRKLTVSVSWKVEAARRASYWEENLVGAMQEGVLTS
jgi:hypothetical protein